MNADENDVLGCDGASIGFMNFCFVSIHLIIISRNLIVLGNILKFRL
jgi:hypothetical protein